MEPLLVEEPLPVEEPHFQAEPQCLEEPELLEPAAGPLQCRLALVPSVLASCRYTLP